jgi:hypothetical protein
MPNYEILLAIKTSKCITQKLCVEFKRGKRIGWGLTMETKTNNIRDFS